MKPKRNNDMTNFLADNYEQWNSTYVKCKCCGYKWVACYPDSVSVSELQCKNCGQQGMTERVEEE